VDYYLPLFFLEMTSVQPGDFCNKVNLCQNIANFSLQVQENSCEFCKDTISSLLDKIQDPDTEVGYFIFM
jgi:saposin